MLKKELKTKKDLNRSSEPNNERFELFSTENSIRPFGSYE